MPPQLFGFKMSRSYFSSVSICALSVVVLSMTACQSVPPSAAVPSSPSDLEKRVSVLEGQMKEAQPTLKKVEVMESHFKALSLDMGRIVASYDAAVENPPLVSTEPAAIPVVKEQAPEPVIKKEKEKAPEKAKAKEPISLSGKLAVTSVRIGEQPKDITRIVLDTTKPAEIHYDLDNGESLLLIDIPQSEWSTTESLDLKKSPMVKSFRASHDDTGAHLVVNLKQAAKVVATARLKPSGGSGNRVYVDIAPAK